MTATGCHGDKICPIIKTACPSVCFVGDILENITTGIVVLDIDKQQVLFQNPYARELFKKTKRNDYRVLSTLLLPDLSELLATPKTTFSKKLTYENRIYGYTVYRLIETYLWIFITDITEKERLQSVAEAVNTMENIGYIFSGIRHEIGNPINSIKMTMSVLRKNIEKYSIETTVEYIDRVLSEIHRVEYLLRSLKNFSLYEKPEVQSIDLRSFMKIFLALVTNDIEKNGISLRNEIRTSGRWIAADPRMLQQVLLNVITNASDSLKDSEAPAISIRAFGSGEHVTIEVLDNGCGIPEEEQKNIFKPFFTTKSEGTGLGLVIVKKMLAGMKGTIAFRSYEKMGTIVTITLPAAISESSEEDDIEKISADYR